MPRFRILVKATDRTKRPSASRLFTPSRACSQRALGTRDAANKSRSRTEQRPGPGAGRAVSYTRASCGAGPATSSCSLCRCAASTGTNPSDAAGLCSSGRFVRLLEGEGPLPERWRVPKTRSRRGYPCGSERRCGGIFRLAADRPVRRRRWLTHRVAAARRPLSEARPSVVSCRSSAQSLQSIQSILNGVDSRSVCWVHSLERHCHSRTVVDARAAALPALVTLKR